MTRGGCRLVQKALMVASQQQRERLAEALLPHALELYTSANANYVLAKFIEIMPPSRVTCIALTMRGRIAAVARHRFGCRILERLMEHCSEQELGFLLDEIQADLEALARHQFGNFVVQHLLEHGSPPRKHAAMQCLFMYLPQHLTHKTASHVVQFFLEHADHEWQAAIVDAMLAARGGDSLEAVAASRYGSFVVRQLLERPHVRAAVVRARLDGVAAQLRESEYSRKNVVPFLGDGALSGASERSQPA